MEKRLDTIDLFLKLLSAESITPDDGGLLTYIENYLSNFEATWINEGGVKNLFLTKKFGEGKHLCFAGHVDVVPAGEGWETNPFVPMIKDGYIYARGTQDMKSGVAAFVQAIRDMDDEFSGRLSLLLTSDEEGDGTYGTQIVLRHLDEIGLLPDYCIIAEPTCEEVFGDAIKIGRRGSINGYLTLKGKQGHAAYPEKSINPIHDISSILVQIAGHDLDNGDDNFSPSKIVLTDIRSGMEVTNVTPNDLKLMFNVRNSTKTTQERVKSFIAEKFDGLDYELRLEQGSYPFVTNRESYIVDELRDAIREVTGVETKLSTVGGTSDGRHIAPYGIEVVEFGVINDRIHALNERTSIEEVETLYNIFVKIVKQF
ncbi:succinyl-diaminopimelate desuccinylase [Sulfurovum sp. bin170]|uniref:succinyl-diaminopimelate desuccinylase n=1 Tax=Sulfurovum sp. bin170 TaxID=2695268 RepID=UPI0013DF402F|nr:succinyl-diaminopimelate desuccinylase [Sulfurovum sp. bin170]NEW60410.1 succinyl-diaminopimelate desuccinylase [Sulfurovum sp. bin170]